MVVKRIVPDIATDDVAGLSRFYAEIFDLDILMDQGWISTLASDGPTRPQISLASEGGPGVPVPNLSIEVDDVAETFARVLKGGHPIEYPMTDEPWGVRRFFLRDPAGTVINVLQHIR